MNQHSVLDERIAEGWPILHKADHQPSWLGYLWAVSVDGEEVFRGTFKPGHLDRDGYGDCQRYALDTYGRYYSTPTVPGWVEA